MMMNILFIYQSCDMSFGNDIELITHENEFHPISSWSVEVNTKELVALEYIQTDGSQDRKSYYDEENPDEDNDSSRSRPSEETPLNSQFGL